MPDALTINIPNLGEEAITIDESANRIAFVKIVQDFSPPNPLEDEDGNGEIVSFNRNHSNFIGYDKEEEIQELLKTPDAVKLGYYEHGLCSWFVSPDEGGTVAAGVEFQWDGRRFAGIWTPDDCATENIDARVKAEGIDRRKAVLEYVQGVCEQYTQWCNGEVYGYDVEVYTLKHDEDGNNIEDHDHYKENFEPIEEDSCYGYYGDDVNEAATAAAKHGLTKALD